MKMEHIKLFIDGEKLDFIVLNEFDGVKEAINLDNKILISWIDEKDTYEEWLVLELKNDVMKKYLSTEIGLLTVIEDSHYYLTKRYFNSFDNLSNKRKVHLDEIKDGLPLIDIPLDVNIYKILFSNIYEISYNTSIQSEEHDINKHYSVSDVSRYRINNSDVYQIADYYEDNAPMVA